MGMAKSILREAPEAALLWAAEVTDKNEHVDLVANTSRVIDQTTPSKAEAMLIEFRLDDSQKKRRFEKAGNTWMQGNHRSQMISGPISVRPQTSEPRAFLH